MNGDRPSPFTLTFDNLGEAAELELGLLPESHPVGRHPSVTDALPRIVELLADLPATFFVEAWNCEAYPDAIRTIAAHGHEIAVHGWRHERWDALDETRERALVERSVHAFAGLGLRPVGFRPPGGTLSPRSAEVLRPLGFTYYSAVGQGHGLAHGMASLPFAWRAVDAYHLDPFLAPLRRSLGDDAAPSPVPRWRQALHGVIEACAESGDYASVIFHPYLLADEERLAVLADVVAHLRADDRLLAVRCREVAHSLVSRP